MIQSHATIRVEELVNILEPLIRRVVREELSEVIEKKPDIFYLEPGTPLYEDMLEIRESGIKNAYDAVFSDESVCREQLETAAWFDKMGNEEGQEW